MKRLSRTKSWEVKVACSDLIYCSGIQDQFPTKPNFKNFSLSQKIFPRSKSNIKNTSFFVLATMAEFFTNLAGLWIIYMAFSIYITAKILRTFHSSFPLLRHSPLFCSFKFACNIFYILDMKDCCDCSLVERFLRIHRTINRLSCTSILSRLVHIF